MNPKNQFSYPTGRKALKLLKYDTEILEQLPDDVANSYYGTGNPFSLGKIEAGETILDFGCGAGIDTIFAAKMTGDQGRVIGIDIIPDMLSRAKKTEATQVLLM